MSRLSEPLLTVLRLHSYHFASDAQLLISVSVAGCLSVFSASIGSSYTAELAAKWTPPLHEQQFQLPNCRNHRTDWDQFVAVDDNGIAFNEALREPRITRLGTCFINPNFKKNKIKR